MVCAPLTAAFEMVVIVAQHTNDTTSGRSHQNKRVVGECRFVTVESDKAEVSQFSRTILLTPRVIAPTMQLDTREGDFGRPLA
jgi:hypothetical protein